MIGEIRDLDTAKISIHSSLTGHLILSTLHTSNAALAPLRLIQMGLDPYSIVSTLNLIIAQRLTRTVCGNCRVTYQLTEGEVKEIEAKYLSTAYERQLFESRFNPKRGAMPRLFKGKGCKECGQSGFKGRTVVAEVMELNSTLRDLIIAQASAEKIEQAAIENGMTTILEDGLNKVFLGKTTLDELFRVINQ
jgi:type II secretory ATPase GspE/PulE/Tfp pilus assembly ATPase PilB-like protein